MECRIISLCIFLATTVCSQSQQVVTDNPVTRWSSVKIGDECIDFDAGTPVELLPAGSDCNKLIRDYNPYFKEEYPLENLKVEDYYPLLCRLTVPENVDYKKGNDICNRRDNLREILVCNTGDKGIGQWVGTGFCQEVTCNLIQSKYLEKVENVIGKISTPQWFEDPSSAQSRAKRAILAAKICPDSVEILENMYVMYVLVYEWKLIGRAGFTSMSPCSWNGVLCGGSNPQSFQQAVQTEMWQEDNDPSFAVRVLEIEWVNLNIRGTIPEEIGALRLLTRLSLDQNYLFGRIPVNIEKLNKLQRLDLDYNEMSGIIRDSISSLQELNWLDLDNNKFIGTLPYNLSKLKDLQLLSLYNNELTGSVPESLGQLKKLEALYLDGNSFTGYCGMVLCQNRNFFLKQLTVDCGIVECPCASKCF